MLSALRGAEHSAFAWFDPLVNSDLAFMSSSIAVDVMPVRYMVLDHASPAAFNYAFYPSDLYCADLAKQNGAFEDWNAMKQGLPRPLLRGSLGPDE
jgi:hypothetical protein